LRILSLTRIFTIAALFTASICTGQARFSVATDLTLQRNFKKEQRYWSIGQTVHAHLHITPTEGVYIWFTYYSNGKFRNNLIATAKSPSTSPQTIGYINRTKMRLKQLSVGYKRYVIGNAYKESGYNYYFFAGFGLELGRVINTQSISIDTSLYNSPVLPGKANFKRLSIDPGIGIEHYLLADIYVYGEARLWIPTTDYPSRYIFVNENAPWVAMLNFGVRVLF
jgi:hypothetical protein